MPCPVLIILTYGGIIAAYCAIVGLTTAAAACHAAAFFPADGHPGRVALPTTVALFLVAASAGCTLWNIHIQRRQRRN